METSAPKDDNWIQKSSIEDELKKELEAWEKLSDEVDAEIIRGSDNETRSN